MEKIKFLSKFLEPLNDSYPVIQKSISGKILFYSSILSMGFWILESIAVYFILLAFEINSLDFFELIPLYTTAIILGVASFLPLGIGVVEGSLASFFLTYKIEFTQAFSLIIFIRIFTRWYSVIIGFIALKFSSGLKKS